MKSFFFAGVCVLAELAIAEPSVSAVSTVHDPASGRVRVTYTLSGGPAIVTFDVTTNGVAVGGANLRFHDGEVCRRVADGTHAFTWHSLKSDLGKVGPVGSCAVSVTAWSPSTPPDYMVVNLVTGETRYYPNAEALPDGGVTNILYKTERMAFRKIPAANVQWRMGMNDADDWGVANECAHLVTLASDCYLAVYELTQKQYYWVMGAMPGCDYTGENREVHPVEKINFNSNRGNAVWNQDGTNVNRSVGTSGFLYQFRSRTGGGFDYPLEALWEFACRAGSGNNLYENSFGYTDLDTWKDSTRLKNICAHRTGQTMPVGTYEPNKWGLYDMLGNVSECCLDHYVDDITQVDPNKGPARGDNTKLTMRGGGYSDDAYRLRTAARQGDGWTGWIHRGLRVACPVDALPTK